jgi:hypothetical protein
MAFVMSPLIFNFPIMYLKQVSLVSVGKNSTKACLTQGTKSYISTYADVGLSFPENNLTKSACDTDITTSDLAGDSPLPVEPLPFFKSK